MTTAQASLLMKAQKRALLQVSRFEIAALKTVERLIKSRVHNDGKQTSGAPIGKYVSRQHIKKRVAKQRQVGYVDLQLYGDLIKGYTVGKSSGKNVFGFLTDLQRLKMEGNELRKAGGRPIANASKGEQAQMDRAYTKEFNFVTEKFLNAVPR